MSTWPQWDVELETHLGIIDTRELGSFFRTWSSEAKSGCGSNPVLASRREPGSTNCKRLPGGKRAQSYTSHKQGIAATAAQLHSGAYPHLLAAITSGNPYSVADTKAVADDLRTWGTPGAAIAYLAEVADGSFGSGVTIVGGTAAHAHGGYRDMVHTFNKLMPVALTNVRAANRAGLHYIERARRVSIK